MKIPPGWGRRTTTAVLLTLVLLALPTAMLGADPSFVPTELLEAVDPRSDGVGPGLVGNPLLILAAVIGLGLATALVTLLLARLLRRD